MNAASEFIEQWEGIRRSFEAGRLAHAYTVVGSPRGHAAVFADSVLKLILGADAPDSPVARRIEQRAHPDVVWVEPQSKSRQIRVDEIRMLNHRLQQTAMEGGWKAGVILYADRITEQAANAFLKTLEEPAGQTLLLLLTEAPQAMLPTIRSRCQQIVLTRSGAVLEGEWREALLSILRDHGGRDPMTVFVASEALRGLLDDIKKSVESAAEQREDEADQAFAARVQSLFIEIRAQVMVILIQWFRDILCCVMGATADNACALHFPEEVDVLQEQARGISPADALRHIEVVEDMARQLERNIPPIMAFQAGLTAHLLQRGR